MPANILLNVGGNVLASHENLIVQVRTGVLTLHDLGALIAHARRFATLTKGNIAFVAVIERDAATVEVDVRAKQKEFISSVVERLDVRMGVVILGDDISSTMRRTMARLMVPGHGRLRVVGSVAEACAFVAPHLSLSAREVDEVVRAAREAARRSA